MTTNQNQSTPERNEAGVSELVTTLMTQAEEIARENHTGWGNTMILAAELFSAQQVELEKLRMALRTIWNLSQNRGASLSGAHLLKAYRIADAALGPRE